MSNRLRLLAVALLALLFVPASAMQQSDLPPRFNVPWGNTAVAPYIRNIPQASQIGVQNCAASLTDGFPPLTFVPAGAGGCPPFGSDFNGVLKQITQWSRWQAAGGPVFYDATLSSNIGGYPKGATVQSSVLVGRIWFSTADNNTTNPDSTSSTNWTVLPGTASPAQLVQTLGSAAQPPNTVPANGQTIGNASSNATNRANADTYWLFVRMWTDCTATLCPLFNSSGGVIARGATANADFAANNAVSVYTMNGTATMASDTQGSITLTNLSGVPVVSGSRTVPGSVLGENLHALTAQENGPHTHANTLTDLGHTHTSNANQANNGASVAAGGNPNIVTQNPATINSAVTGITINNASSGSGNGHNTVPRSFLTSNWLCL
jgi:hypothetical protein